MYVEPTSRFPGVYFLADPQLEPTALPRMDVAAFVGFASQGPFHLPVAVEDPGQFRDIFGPDLSLAWDSERKRLQQALLGATVELFFRNGGRRCWVVRVAQENGEGAAVQHHFRVPGLYLLTDPLQPARVTARCPGAWAAELSVASRLVSYPLAIEDFTVPGSPDHGYALQVASVPLSIKTGELIELRWAEARLRAFLFVDTMEIRPGGLHLRGRHVSWFAEISAPGSPDLEVIADLMPLSEAEGLAVWAAAGSPPPAPRARVQRFELQAWQSERMLGGVAELGFDRRHPRYWGRLPDDGRLFGEILARWQGGEPPRLEALEAETLHPRFALAGGDAVAERSLPLGMSLSSRGDVAAGSTDGPVAEGLGRFSAGLFLDGDLVATTTTTLAAEAKHKAEVLRRPLKGIHSLWNIHEVSLIAVPDAIHRHWDKKPRPGDRPLNAPWLEDISPPDERGRRVLFWSAVPGIKEYRVQQSNNPDFEFFKEHRVQRPTRLELLSASDEDGEPDNQFLLTLEDDCPRDYYFRVRAVGYTGASPWSNTLALHLPKKAFHVCVAAAVEDLGLVLEVFAGPTPGIQRLCWTSDSPTGLDPRVIGFELQQASEADFVSPQTLRVDGESHYDVSLASNGRNYYRVRALTPEGPGPWSNTEFLDPDALRTETLRPESEYDSGDLLAVHRALVRLCATRADTVALLGLPSHYRAAELSRYLAALGADIGVVEPIASLDDGAITTSTECLVPGLRQGERGALGFACVLHPWLRLARPVPNRGDAFVRAPTLVPPDGAAAGLVARGARVRGAWISPANQPLVDVLGVSPLFEDATVAGLAERGINLVHPAPRGFLLSRADTLSATRELRPLSVRRFMTLLRRLIRREGNRYVFEPNSDDFREAVQAQWEELLQDLYVRGALRGRSPDAAFRVVTDASVNDIRAAEHGRFVVELHVAPSQPLRFLNVRLIQSDPDQLLVQEL